MCLLLRKVSKPNQMSHANVWFPVMTKTSMEQDTNKIHLEKKSVCLN